MQSSPIDRTIIFFHNLRLLGALSGEATVNHIMYKRYHAMLTGVVKQMFDFKVNIDADK